MHAPGTYGLLVFDLDGTLINSEEDLAAAVNHVRAGFEMQAVDLATIRSYIGSGVAVLVQRALPGLTDRQLSHARERFRDYYLAHLLDHTVVFPGIREILNRLSGRSTMAVLTNKSEEYTLKILAGLRLDGYFKIIWGGDTGKQRKPDPGPLREIMGRLDFKPEATLMIGDGPNDILAARAAGVASLALGYGYTPQRELARLQPDYYAATIPELAGMLHKRIARHDA